MMIIKMFYYVCNLAVVHFRKIRPYKIRNCLRLYHKGIVNIYQILSHNFQEHLNRRYLNNCKKYILRRVFLENRRNYCHKYRTSIQHNQAGNNKRHHCYLILGHIRKHKNVLMKLCRDIYRVGNLFHYQVMDLHNNFQCTYHSYIRLYNLDNSNTLQFLNHKQLRVHCSYKAGSRGSSNTRFDIDYTLSHKCLVDNYIDR